jgi:Bacterial lectin
MGGFWRLQPVPVLSGFETFFRFQVGGNHCCQRRCSFLMVLLLFPTSVSQITDHSRSCTYHKDRHFRTFHHKVSRLCSCPPVMLCSWEFRLSQSCTVHGGDGFAFVLHLDANATATLGRGGEEMGYAGIRNSLVIEFDTWYNPDQADLFTDHVRCVKRAFRRIPIALTLAATNLFCCYSVQLSGPKGEVTAGVHHRLASVVPHELADGRVHIVRIVYYRFINYDYLPFFTGSSYLQQFLKDNGEVGRHNRNCLCVSQELKLCMLTGFANRNLGCIR